MSKCVVHGGPRARAEDGYGFVTRTSGFNSEPDQQGPSEPVLATLMAKTPLVSIDPYYRY